MTGETALIPSELEMFATLLAAGKTPAQAYRESSVGVAMACGLPLLMTAETKARVEWLREHAPGLGDPAAGEPQYDPKKLSREDIVRMLLSARINALTLKNASAEVKAVELLGKTLGIFEDHVQVSGEVTRRVIIVPAKQRREIMDASCTDVTPPRSLALTRHDGRRDN